MTHYDRYGEGGGKGVAPRNSVRRKARKSRLVASSPVIIGASVRAGRSDDLGVPARITWPRASGVLFRGSLLRVDSFHGDRSPLLDR